MAYFLKNEHGTILEASADAREIAQAAMQQDLNEWREIYIEEEGRGKVAELKSITVRNDQPASAYSRTEWEENSISIKDEFFRKELGDDAATFDKELARDLPPPSIEEHIEDLMREREKIVARIEEREAIKAEFAEKDFSGKTYYLHGPDEFGNDQRDHAFLSPREAIDALKHDNRAAAYLVDEQGHKVAWKEQDGPSFETMTAPEIEVHAEKEAREARQAQHPVEKAFLESTPKHDVQAIQKPHFAVLESIAAKVEHHRIEKALAQFVEKFPHLKEEPKTEFQAWLAENEQPAQKEESASAMQTVLHRHGHEQEM